MEIGKATTIIGKIKQLLKIKACKLTKIKIKNNRNNRNKIILNQILNKTLSKILSRVIKINKIYKLIPMI